MKKFENLHSNILNGNIKSSKKTIKRYSREERLEFIEWLEVYNASKTEYKLVIKWCILGELS